MSVYLGLLLCCFFKQKTAYDMRISDWSSDVCSSDLLAEIGDRIERHVVTAALHRIDLMLHQPETGRAVGERGAEDRHVMLIGELDEAVFLLAVLHQPFAHFADERAR